MELMSEQDFRLHKIFDPEGARKRLDLLFQNRKLVHYTSADTALKIIRSGEVWMRNVRCMNDFMEVEHGFEMMKRFFAPPSEEEPDIGRTELFAALDDIVPDLSTQSMDNFNGWLATVRTGSFITCISEHYKKEDENGRLSMWRSYGMSAVGVGIVINPLPLYSKSDALKAYSNPVSYQTPDEFFATLRAVAQNIRTEREFLKSLPVDQVSGSFFNLLLYAALCSKHPGFEEEQEWRIIHIPQMWPSTVLKRSTEVIGGVPQSVYKIPLKDVPDEGLVGIELPSLLDRIIIGPTDYPLVVHQAFVEELTAVGVTDAASKIVASRIPLRNGS
jgi:hypothetical protein